MYVFIYTLTTYILVEGTIIGAGIYAVVRLKWQ